MRDKEELHKATKQFVYQIIMTFKDFENFQNEHLINEILQSATRLSAHCREMCTLSDEDQQTNELSTCKILLDEIIYLLNLLENTKTFEWIKTEEIILTAFELKQEIMDLCQYHDNG